MLELGAQSINDEKKIIISPQPFLMRSGDMVYGGALCHMPASET
jgi:hypothetical protein